VFKARVFKVRPGRCSGTYDERVGAVDGGVGGRVEGEQLAVREQQRHGLGIPEGSPATETGEAREAGGRRGEMDFREQQAAGLGIPEGRDTRA